MRGRGRRETEKAVKTKFPQKKKHYQKTNKKKTLREQTPAIAERRALRILSLSAGAVYARAVVRRSSL
jgi:hypothetical protein